MNKAEISMDEYLELLEIKKNFDEKLNYYIKDYDLKKTKEINNLTTEKYIIQSNLNDLRGKYRNKLLKIDESLIEFEGIKKKWWYKLLYQLFKNLVGY